MTVPAAGAPMRTSRGAGFAVAALGLGIGAHVVGGGALPGLGPVVFLAVPVLWMAFFLTRARRRWPTVITSLLVIETGLHEALSILSSPLRTVASIPVTSPGQVVMGGHAGISGDAAGMLAPAHGMTGIAGIPSVGMLTAHLVATVLTGAVLAYGEHLLWSLWTWLHHAVTIVTALVQLPAPWVLARSRLVADGEPGACCWPTNRAPTGRSHRRRIGRPTA